MPTGNFGDIFAGYVAKSLLPEGLINRLILATNSNDILTRFVRRGDYSKGTVSATISPSMDIQVASNFERYLYYLRGENAGQVVRDMEVFGATGSLDLSARGERVAADFASRAVSEEETLATIREFYTEHDYLLDPHTAVGVCAGKEFRDEKRPMVCLATAHPAKFGEAVTRAIGQPPELPPSLAALHEKDSRCEVLDADAEQIKAYLREHARS